MLLSSFLAFVAWICFSRLCHATITINTESCSSAEQVAAGASIENMEAAKNEVFDMAENMIAQMGVQGYSEKRRVEWVTSRLLACKLGSAICERAKSHAQLIADLRDGGRDIEVFCGDIPNDPDGVRQCKQDRNKLTAYALTQRGQVVICPWVWANFNAENLITLSSWRDKDLTKPWPGKQLDQLQSLSSTLYHELSHAVSLDPRYPKPGSSIKDVVLMYPMQNIMGYGIVRCLHMAVADNAAQGRNRGADLAATEAYMIEHGERVTEDQSGYCIFNADSLKLAAMQFYLDKNDFMSTGVAQGYNSGGFRIVKTCPWLRKRSLQSFGDLWNKQRFGAFVTATTSSF